MGLIDNLKTAVSNFGQGLEEFGKGVADGSLKEEFQGITKTANGLINESPLGLAANALTGNALQKMCDGEEKHLDKAFNNVDDGLHQVEKGIEDGNLGEIGKGVVDAGWGSFQMARAATPLGVAEGTIGDGLVKPELTGQSAANSDAQANAKADAEF